MVTAEGTKHKATKMAARQRILVGVETNPIGRCWFEDRESDGERGTLWYLTQKEVPFI